MKNPKTTIGGFLGGVAILATQYFWPAFTETVTAVVVGIIGLLSKDSGTH